MSKERELLQECYFYIDNKINASSNTLLARVDKLLAQPERDFIREIQYLTDCLMEAEEKVSKLLAQPEQSEQKPTAWVYQWKEGDGMYLSYFKLGKKPPRMCKFSMRNLRALYTSSPKLTPRQGLEEYKKGYAKAEDDLKLKPLSEDEIWEGVKNERAISHSSFTLGVKFAEKEHGITGGEE